MAFLIPDNLKSRKDVPAAIRRAASAFEIGLDDSAVVWYEPLYDPNGEKPHLVVMLPDRGIALLEVVDAKASSFLHFFKGKPKFVRDGEELPDPLERASSLAHLLVKRINAEPRISKLGLSVAAGVCLANLTKEQAKENGVDLAYPEDFCIYKDELDAAISGTGESTLMRAFTRLVGPSVVDYISSDLEKVIRGIIQPDIVIGSTFKSDSEQLQIFLPPTEDDVIRVMDRQQEAMAKTLGDGHRVIRGVAGSGKTLVLLFRAKLIAENFPNKQILVTCYTKTLASQLKKLLQNYSNIDVINLHLLIYEICKEAKVRIPDSKDENRFEKMTALALEAVELGKGPRYDMVLVDEAQDFDTNEIKLATRFLKDSSEDLVIVADAAQNIFKRKFSWKQAGVKAQGRTRILRTNYRNTRQILEFASAFLLGGETLTADEVPDFEDENSVIPPEAAKRTGALPEVEFVTSTKDEISSTIELTKSWLSKLGPDQKLAILYPGTDDKDRGYLLNRDLRYEGIDLYWVNERNNRAAKAGLAATTSRVILSTVQSAKGLEFPNVILCGIWKRGSDKEQLRKLAYVGMTRATDHLMVISRDSHELVDDLKDAAKEFAEIKQLQTV